MTTNTIDKLRVFMAARNLDQTRLAEAMGVSISIVSYILNGKRPITGGFKWKFTAAFGHDVARVVFDNHDSEVDSAT